MNELETRRTKLFESLKQNSIALIFSGVSKIKSEDENYPFFANRNFFYLTGIEQENSVLLLIKTLGENKEFLFIDEYNELKERWTGKKLPFDRAMLVSGIENVYPNSNLQSMLKMIFKEGKDYGDITNVYLDLSDEIKINTNYSTILLNAEINEKEPQLDVINVYPLITELRTIKSEEEIANIVEAINITNQGINDLLINLKEGMFEYELSNRFEFYGKNHDLKELAFDTITAAGKDATVLHHPIRQQLKTLKNDEMVLFDLGYRFNGYCADISRTYPINGKFEGEQKKVYEAVLCCNKAVIEMAKPGLSIHDLQEFTFECLKREAVRLGLMNEDEDIKKYYIHNISHYLGLDTHDVGDRMAPLKPGNVITVEPGLYFVEKGIGVRIEDDVLITETGCECLSKGIVKEIADVERLMKSGRGRNE